MQHFSNQKLQIFKYNVYVLLPSDSSKDLLRWFKLICYLDSVSLKCLCLKYYCVLADHWLQSTIYFALVKCVTCSRFRRVCHMTQFSPKWQAFVFCAASHRRANIKLSERLAWNHENVSAVSLKGLDEMKGHDSVHFQIVSLEKAFIVLQTTVLTESDRGSWVERNKESLSHLANLCFKWASSQ